MVRVGLRWVNQVCGAIAVAIEETSPLIGRYRPELARKRVRCSRFNAGEKLVHRSLNDKTRY